MHYILIDYENVQPDIRPMAEDFEIDVTVFIGPRQRVNRQTNEAIQQMDTRGEVIKVSNAGPNALDFHLAFHLGQLVMSDATSTFEIISNDKGYDSLVNQLAAKGVQIQRTPGIHRPEGYKAHEPSFTPFYLRHLVKNQPDQAPKPVVSEPSRDLSSIRGTIKSLERNLQSLKATQPRTPRTQRQIKKANARITLLKQALAAAMKTTKPDKEIGSSGRKTLRLPVRS